MASIREIAGAVGLTIILGGSIVPSAEATQPTPQPGPVGIPPESPLHKAIVAQVDQAIAQAQASRPDLSNLNSKIQTETRAAQPSQPDLSHLNSNIQAQTRANTQAAQASNHVSTSLSVEHSSTVINVTPDSSGTTVVFQKGEDLNTLRPGFQISADGTIEEAA